MIKPNFRQNVAEEMLKLIEQGTAPWQKPWDANKVRSTPFNPTSEKTYKGMNQFWLEMQGYADPRWMTYKQAADMGVQVKKGERATSIEYWKWSEQKPSFDDSGKPKLDDKGKQVYQTVRLARPQTFRANVFNAEQIDGLEPFVPPPLTFDPIEKAEDILANIDVPIKHDQADRCFYRGGATDEIHMVAKEGFETAHDYYAIALHEVGHSTGHETRLNRDMGNIFGSEKYAIEELRAEMASYMLTTELGLGHNPERHAPYIESWMKAIKGDKNILFKAAQDAEKITDWVLNKDKRLEMGKEAEMSKSMQGRDKINPTKEKNTGQSFDRTYLNVPYADKNQAKKAGAKWGRKAKSWFAPESVTDLERWLPENTKTPAPTLDPVQEFKQALEDHGFIIKGAPEMDGKWHRSPLADDSKGKKSGSYRGFIDGIPNGQMKNFKDGNEAHQWVATGSQMSESERIELKRQGELRKVKRVEELKEQHKEAAKTAYGRIANAKPVMPDHPYLEKKGIKPSGLKLHENSNAILVSLQDTNGFIWSTQTISENGDKLFLKNGRKEGLFHVMGKTDLKEAKEFTITEGVATGASIHEATNEPVIIAFDSGNLKPVAKAIRAINPNAKILIAADNDHALVRKPTQKKNIGITKANEAAKAVDGDVAFPSFTKEQKEKGLTDFNDLALDKGLKAVAKALKPSKAKQQSMGI